MLSSRPLLLFEINEFNLGLVREAADLYDFKNIKKILSLNSTETQTNDTLESDWLEPWVQWVSIHTGLESSQHKIKHLGDVPDLKFKQLWEVLDEHGVSWGVWGVLNGSRGRGERCKFFVPDPWTFSEMSFPPRNNHVLNFPRYLAKHRENYSRSKALWLFAKLIIFGIPLEVCFRLVSKASLIIRTLFAFNFSFSAFFFIFEYVSFCTFQSWKGKTKPRFSIFFFNSLAHAQHYYWDENWKANTKLKCVLEWFDAIAALVLKEKTTVMFANGLSQVQTYSEAPWYMYILKSHKAFLNCLGLYPVRIEPLMSYDMILEFRDKTEAAGALTKLLGLRLQEKPLFLVEQSEVHECKLFVRLSFTEKWDQISKVKNAEGPVCAFDEHFVNVVKRAAKHSGRGIVLTDVVGLPSKIQNYEIFGLILKWFNIPHTGNSL